MKLTRFGIAIILMLALAVAARFAGLQGAGRSAEASGSRAAGSK